MAGYGDVVVRTSLLFLLVSLTAIVGALSQSTCCWYDSGQCTNSMGIHATTSRFYDELGASRCFSVLSAAMCAPCSGLINISDRTVGGFCTGFFKEINYTQIQLTQNSTDCFQLPDLAIVRGARCMSTYFDDMNTSSTTSIPGNGTTTSGGNPLPKKGKKSVPKGAIILGVIGFLLAFGAWLIYAKMIPGLRFDRIFSCFRKEEKVEDEGEEGTNTENDDKDDDKEDDDDDDDKEDDKDDSDDHLEDARPPISPPSSV